MAVGTEEGDQGVLERDGEGAGEWLEGAAEELHCAGHYGNQRESVGVRYLRRNRERACLSIEYEWQAVKSTEWSKLSPIIKRQHLLECKKVF